LEEVQSMRMPFQDLAAIHALAHESCQRIANCEVGSSLFHVGKLNLRFPVLR